MFVSLWLNVCGTGWDRNFYLWFVSRWLIEIYDTNNILTWLSTSYSKIICSDWLNPIWDTTVWIFFLSPKGVCDQVTQQLRWFGRWGFGRQFNSDETLRADLSSYSNILSSLPQTLPPLSLSVYINKSHLKWQIAHKADRFHSMVN